MCVRICVLRTCVLSKLYAMCFSGLSSIITTFDFSRTNTDQARMFYTNRYHWNQVLAQNQLAAASQMPGLIPGMGMHNVPGMPAPMVNMHFIH